MLKSNRTCEHDSSGRSHCGDGRCGCGRVMAAAACGVSDRREWESDSGIRAATRRPLRMISAGRRSSSRPGAGTTYFAVAVERSRADAVGARRHHRYRPNDRASDNPDRRWPNVIDYHAETRFDGEATMPLQPRPPAPLPVDLHHSAKPGCAKWPPRRLQPSPSIRGISSSRVAAALRVEIEDGPRRTLTCAGWWHTSPSTIPRSPPTRSQPRCAPAYDRATAPA